MNILDTNIFNRLLDGKLSVHDLPVGRYIVTHIQRDELNNTPDAVRRADLQIQFDALVDEVAPTESAVLDVWRLNAANLGDGIIYERIRAALDAAEPQRVPANTSDALIGETAIIKGYVLLTTDTTFANVVQSLGGKVILFS